MPATEPTDPAHRDADLLPWRCPRSRLHRPRAWTAALAGLLLPLAVAGCESDESGGARSTVAESVRDSARVERPPTRSGTVRVEGMPEVMELALFRADDFPLPFSAYVTADMAAERTDERTVHFFAEFGGQRQEDAFLHLFVFPEGTGRQEALATAKGYKTGRGLPVSRGLEPIADAVDRPQLDWAMEAYRFRYQAEGRWFGGTLGVGRHDDRFFMIVRHRPVEMGDGFAPRADLIMETWRWGDGSGLQPGPAEEPPPIVEGSPTPGG